MSLLGRPLSVVAAIALATGCVGAHGTRGRAYAIDTGLAAVGAAAIALAVQNVHNDSYWGYAMLGVMTGAAGGGGLILTAIGQLGELTRDTSDPAPVFAVRPWTPVPERMPINLAAIPGDDRELATQALTQARAFNCEDALDATDRLSTTPAVHAALVRDPAIAACIDQAFAR